MTATGEKTCRNETKTEMPLEVAKWLLEALRRDCLHDRAFGDSEILWFLGDEEIAWAYFSKTIQTVGFREIELYAQTTFKDAEAEELQYLYQESRTDFNDAGDPRFR